MKPLIDATAMHPDTPSTRSILSVVVVTYNCRDLVSNCLHALERQRDEIDFETLLVDNASTDGTFSFVSESFPWVDVSSADSNVGFARATNSGLQQANGEYVLLLNPDTVVPDGGLAKVLAAMEARPDAGMLGCKLVKPDGVLDHACKRSFPTPATALAYFARLDRFPWLNERLGSYGGRYTTAWLADDQEAPVDAVNGAFMLVRRQALEAVGPLDERFWLYGEDLDWCCRFWAAGWPVIYWPGVTVIHAKGGSSGPSRSWTTNRAFHRCMWLFYRKHQFSRDRPILNAAVWTAIWAKFLVSSARGFAHRGARELTRYRQSASTAGGGG